PCFLSSLSSVFDAFSFPSFEIAFLYFFVWFVYNYFSLNLSFFLSVPLLGFFDSLFFYLFCLFIPLLFDARFVDIAPVALLSPLCLILFLFFLWDHFSFFLYLVDL
ncbi:hypothetical protein PanWU01x14_292680, partial [Parasponia andersonii]